MKDNKKLWEALLKVQTAHAFSKEKWDSKFDHIEEGTTEHIIKILIWGNSTTDQNGWTNTVVNKFLMPVAGRRIETENGTRPLTIEEYKKGIFDAEMSEPEEFQGTVMRVTYNLIESEGYPEIEEPDYYELWFRFCKVRDELLQEMTKTVPSKATMREICSHFAIWNYANTY